MIVNVGGRTDIANYYSEWLMNRIKEGFAYSRNPLFREQCIKSKFKPKRHRLPCVLFKKL